MAHINAAAWYAFHVRPKHEKSVAAILTQKGYSVFLPLRRERRTFSHKKRNMELPLFPGYVFSIPADASLTPIVRTPGVVDAVRAGMTPLPVDSGEIESLQKSITADLGIQPWPFTKTGEPVRVIAGRHRIPS